MSEPFNKLTPAQAERLAMLAEECAEVILIIGKILRHGYDSHHPETPTITNRDILHEELLDVTAVASAMGMAGDATILDSMGFYGEAAAQRWRKKLRWTHHQGDEA